MASQDQLNVLNDAIAVLSLLGKHDVAKQVEAVWDSEFIADHMLLVAV